MADGPVGAHIPAPTIAYAGGIGLAASWDTDLALRIGQQLRRDARSRGSAFLLGPGVNIYRAPMNGRNFEYFGEDPFLASGIAVGYIRGVQQEGVSATVKHYLGNNSEYGDFHVTFDVTNTGQRPGATVAQLYVGEDSAKVERPTKELKGFVRVMLQPGETKSCSLDLNPKSFSYFDVASSSWKADAGSYTLILGDSSQEIKQETTVRLGKDMRTPVSE